MNETVNRKYAFVLAVLAASLLATGYLLKPRKSEPRPPSPSETASLQARIRREELGNTAAYFGQRAQVLGQYVTYDPAHEASAIVWETPGQWLTTRRPGADPAAPPLALTKGAAAAAIAPRAADQTAGRWVLMIGRTADQQLLWTPAVYGGTRQTTCEGAAYQELIVNARLDPALAGGAAFDLDGMMVGVVAGCDASYHLVSLASVTPLLQAFAASNRPIQTAYGLKVGELTSAAKRLFDLNAGLLVTEVDQGGAAYQASLRAGDVIVSFAGQPVSQAAAFWSALKTDTGGERLLEVVRQRRKTSVRLPSMKEAEKGSAGAASLLGLQLLPAPRRGEELRIALGTPAYRSGLRSGDRLLQVDNRRTPTAADLVKAITALDNHPLLVVYERNRTDRATLVTP